MLFHICTCISSSSTGILQAHNVTTFPTVGLIAPTVGRVITETLGSNPVQTAYILRTKGDA